MSHGWEETGRTVVVLSRKCSKGNGQIVTYGVEEESDYPPFTRCDEKWEECICKDTSCTQRRSK